MRKIVTGAAGVVLGLTSMVVVAPGADAAAARKFKNCTEMNKVYKGGVGKPGAKDKRPGGGKAKYAPHRSTALYNANKGSDRDKDGIACEK